MAQMITVLTNNFGTNDMEWFCAAEQMLNTLFAIDAKKAPNYARFVIFQLIKHLYPSF